MVKRIRQIWRLVFIFLILLLLFTNSGVPSSQFTEKVRVQTRWIEFDYVSWTIDALLTKFAQASLGTNRYMESRQQAKIMQDQLDLVIEHRQLKESINQIYSDPAVENPELTAKELLNRQRQVQTEMAHIGLLSEAVLQQQVSQVLKQNELSFLGQPIPPVQYHGTALPYALIVSPRNVI